MKRPLPLSFLDRRQFQVRMHGQDRSWKPKEFDAIYESFFCSGEQGQYHRRYRFRYQECLCRFAMLAPSQPVDVLDIGGGQLALLAHKLWNDRAVLADLPGHNPFSVGRHGVRFLGWNLCRSDAPFMDKFDFVFLSEVIEHLPIPGYIALERLRKVLKPGGALICTTPNLYRLRNVVYMATGKQIFAHFEYPDDAAKGLSHVLEYSREHLAWQFQKAGFEGTTVEYVQMHHLPTNPLFRPIAFLGYPLHLVPRWRDNLVAIGSAPSRRPE